MRLIVIVSLGLAVLGTGSAGPAASQGVARTAAQTYPSQPIRLVVPWPPGGTADTLGRIIAQHLATSFGQQVVADNRPGAGSTIGVGIVAKSTADGHTLLYTDVTTITINATFYPKLPYDTIRDFTPVTMVGTSPLLLVVHPSVPARTVRELVAHAKAEPGALNVSSAGNGSALHLAAEMFRAETGINLVHVPYKGGGPAMTALLGGEVQLNFAGIITALPHLKAGALRALATTKSTRSQLLPDVPALAETYPGFEILLVNGMLGPAGLPPQIVAKLNSEVEKVLAKPDVIQRFEALGVETKTSTPEELMAYIKTEIGRFGKIIRETGASAS